MPMSPAGFITDVSGPLAQGVHAGLGIAEMQQRTALLDQQRQARQAQTAVLANLARQQLTQTRAYQQTPQLANPSQPGGYGAGGGGESDGPGSPGGAMGQPAPQVQAAPDPADDDWERMINVAERSGSPEALSLLVKEGRTRESRAKAVMVTRHLKDTLKASGASIQDPRWQTMFHLLEAADDPEHMLQDIASKNAASLAQDPLNQARIQGANERAGIQADAGVERAGITANSGVERANIGADASRYRTDVGATTAANRLGETTRHNQTGEGMAQDRLDETTRHHGVQEQQGQARLEKPSTGTLVNWSPYRRADDAAKHARTMMDSLWKEISSATLTGEDVTQQKAEYEQAKKDLGQASKARDDALVEWEKTGGKQSAAKPAAAVPAEDPQAKQKVIEMIDTLKKQGKSPDEIYQIIKQAQQQGRQGP